MKECFLCGQVKQTDRHHIFGASMRKKSEKYGLVVDLCRNCHTEGKNSVHKNARTMEKLHIYGQKKAMQENGWSIEDFRREFYKNYLEE